MEITLTLFNYAVKELSMMWRNHLKMAWRSLASNKVSASINIMGLSIGMTAAILIFIWVQNELTFDRYYEHSEDIYRVISHVEGSNLSKSFAGQPLFLSEVGQKEIPEVLDFLVLREAFNNPLLEIDGKKIIEEKEMAYVSPNWFKEFNYRVLEGSIEDFNKDKFGLALTQSQAIKYFGEQQALGREVQLDSTLYTVKLILGDNPPNSSFQFKTFLPQQSIWPTQSAYERDYDSGNYNYLTFFRCHPSSDPQKVAKKLEAIMQKQAPDEISPLSVTVVPISGMRFNQELSEDYLSHRNQSQVYFYALIGILLLLTASLNYINLTTALISRKVQEIGLKKIVGANFRHIFFQIITETAVVSILAFSLALSLVWLCLPALSEYMETSLTLNLGNTYLIAILTGVFFLNILISGIYPAILFAGFRPVNLLKKSERSTNRLSLREILVSTQFIITLVVLISAGVIYQQLHFIQHQRVGYVRSQVIEITPNLIGSGDIRNNYDRFSLFAQQLKELAGIESVAITNASLTQIEDQNRGSFKWAGKPEDLKVIVSQLAANEGLPGVFDLNLIDGRWFSPASEADRNSFIVNEAAVREFDLPQPVVGQKVSFRNRAGEIIGVVENFHYKSFHHKIDPLIIRNNNGRGNFVSIKIPADNVAKTLSSVEKLFHDFLPEIPFNYQFSDETFLNMHQGDFKIGALFWVFAGLLMFISGLGLIGLTYFAVERRAKEIGIRKVLGASIVSVMGLLTTRFLQLLLVAIILAFPIAWYLMQRWLNTYAYHTDWIWPYFIFAGLTVAGLTILTVGIQGLKAGMMNPIENIRDD